MFSRECGLADPFLSTRELGNITICSWEKKRKSPLQFQSVAVQLLDWLVIGWISRFSECGNVCVVRLLVHSDGD